MNLNLDRPSLILYVIVYLQSFLDSGEKNFLNDFIIFEHSDYRREF